MEIESWSLLKALGSRRFLEKVSQQFGIDTAILATLLKEFELIPREECVPSDDDPLPGTMTQVAEKIGLPVRVVGRLQDIGAIGRPITFADWVFLQKYKQLWGNHFLLRCQMTRYSQSQRDELVRRPELGTKWERFAYKVLLTNRLERGTGGRMINPGDQIRISNLANMIAEIFGIPNSKSLQDRLRKIRETAYNDRKRARTENTSLEEMARRRCVKLDDPDDP